MPDETVPPCRLCGSGLLGEEYYTALVRDEIYVEICQTCWGCLRRITREVGADGEWSERDQRIYDRVAAALAPATGAIGRENARLEAEVKQMTKHMQALRKERDDLKMQLRDTAYNLQTQTELVVRYSSVLRSTYNTIEGLPGLNIKKL